MPPPTSATSLPSISLPNLPSRSNAPPPSYSATSLPSRPLRPTMRPRRHPTSLLHTATEDLRAVFDMFDDNRNSLIDANEFAQIITLLEHSPPTQAQLHRHLRVACQTPPDNPNVPQALTFRQFLTFLAIEYGDSGNVEMHHVYRVLDKNGDGKVTEQELCSVLNGFGVNVSDTEASAMLDMMKEGCNDVSLHQFQRLVERVNHYSDTNHVDMPSDLSSDEGCRPPSSNTGFFVSK